MNETTMEGNQVSQNLKNMARDAEDFVKETSSGLGDRARDARARLAASLASARESLGHLNEKAIAGAKATDKVIRDHPYQSIGIAFGVGILIGVLVTRK